MSENNGRDLEPIFVIGYPGSLGGACTELWHILKLWRRAGLDVTLIPTWSAPEPEWLQKTNAIGCVTQRANPNLGKSKDEPRGSADVPLKDIDGLPGGIVVSFCNDQFLPHVDQFRELNCRIVWVNCMNWMHPMERKLYALFGPFDAYVFQSKHQSRTLSGQLSGFGAGQRHMHHIPGYIDAEEFAFNPKPHAEDEEFVIGRMSRAAPDKFSTNTWPIIDRVDYPKKRYRIMGYDKAITKTIGEPPEWAETFGHCHFSAADFLASLHCYCQINGLDTENWPRTGLEAMASGVPLVVEDRGGWPEMIEHRQTGFVCKSDAEMAHWMAHLAYDEEFRLEIAQNAWLRLVCTLADPKDLWDRWRQLFRSLPKKPKPKGAAPNGRNGKSRNRRCGGRNRRRGGRPVRGLPEKVGV